MNLIISFQNSIYTKKNGELIDYLNVSIYNEEKEGFEFMDFKTKIPKNEVRYIIDAKDLKKDNYGRYIINDYVISAKYTFAMNILISEETERKEE